MRRAISTTSILGLVLLVFVGFSALILNFGGGEINKTVRASELHVVERGGFDIRVPSSGELASEEQIGIRNLLDTDAVLISVVDEGSIVQEGDILFELNDEKIRENIRNSEINVNAAQNDLLNAETALSIAQKKQESELSVKRLAVELATLALMAWQEGEVVATRQTLTLAVQTAEKNYQRLLKKHESSLRLYEQKFLSKDELDQDEIALLNADATLKKAKLEVTVYENYTFQQEKQKKGSDLEQAVDELDRATDRLASEIRQSSSNLETRTNQLEKREEQLANRQLQLENCKVVSPASGMVVYASSLGDRREDQDRLRVGLSLYKNQLVLIIPDTSNMIASVKVNEALSGLIEPGQKASVTCDAYPESIFEGEVVAVGILAVGGGWRDPNRRDYTVEIKINNPSQVKLKPSMRCAAEIFIGEIEDELYVPIHTIHRDGEFIWVWKEDRGGFSQHPIEIGKFSESFVVVKGGIEEGDVVLLREPTPSTVVSRLDLGGGE